MENISLKLSPKSFFFFFFFFDKLIFVEMISILNNSLICLYYSLLIFKHAIKFKIFQSTQWSHSQLQYLLLVFLIERGEHVKYSPEEMEQQQPQQQKQKQQQQQQIQMHSRSANDTCEIVFCYYTCMTVRIIY